ncbi:hypothetical protein C8A05DRAFT_35101 [Staphylotrichum tortipilum]|uniref:Uncharacterized protein n=1 Tax=Staphylotrichum tortipilum TaxID=2831512 RepID=A0AAN6MJ67_9PEZI|nr:hypothetical protein C8A05DRAFT_35101 [Staphylotrichum longicolle]
MSQAYDDAGEGAVFVGFWVDHDRGNSILGATLTLRARHAVVLMAFLAILVTFAATQSWLFWRFLLHSLISAKAQDASAPALLRHEVIIRNDATPSTALWSLLSTPALEPNTRKDSQRGFFLGLFTTGHVLAFAAASILTSQVIIGQTVVSRVTETCRQWATTYEGGFMKNDVYYLGLELARNATLDADNYHQSDQECLFGGNVCLTGTRPFVMDSGNITFADLGINSKLARGLTVRRRSTCAPLDAERFRVPNPPEVAANALVTFSTYAFLKSNGSWSALQYLRHPNVSVDYDLQAYTVVAPPGLPGVELTEPLQKDQDEHTVSFILLSGTGIMFNSPNDDPLFSAQRQAQNSTRYRMDKAANMIGCAEQAQLCNSLTGRCTSWTGLFDSDPDLLSVLGGETTADGLMDIVRSTTLIQLSLQTTSLPASVGERTAGAALQAGRYLYAGTQVRIEPEQWKREIEYWFAVGLARLQLEVFGTVEKPPGVDPSMAVNVWDRPEYKALKALCGGVKFRSPGHTSLSALGFGLTLGVSGVLVLLSFADVVVPWLLRRCGYEFQEWEHTGMLKLLQRKLELERCLDTEADPFLVAGTEKGVNTVSTPYRDT